ncbi:MAG: 50S ribosomal protein L18 [Planctomycetota bacterium]
MKASEIKKTRRVRRKNSVRRRIAQTGCGVRLSVHRSLKHIYAQVIDDHQGVTLCAVGTAAKALAGELEGKNKSERAAAVGREIARRAKEKGVEQVVFDRGYSKFHGRVKALADAAREEGLKF